MNPSCLFILRPLATSLLMVAILLAGIVAYRVLPLSALPESSFLRQAGTQAKGPLPGFRPRAGMTSLYCHT